MFRRPDGRDPANEFSASDGDIFPYDVPPVRSLGKLIGKRSWGGVVGIPRHRSSTAASLNVPEFGFANGRRASGSIEGYGVDPDIVVDNDPKSVHRRRDPQLERAVAEVMKALETRPPLPARPAAPVRTEKGTAPTPPSGSPTSPRVR